jgi:hypothetical protein
MQLVDRIEKRRFVGREFLLLLWMESELFDATLTLPKHGSFGFWLEKRLTLSAEKESTKITAAMPGLGREAKAALLRGQLPESAGVRLARNGNEQSFSLRADSLGVSGLKLSTVLDRDPDAGSGDLVDELMGKKGRGKKREETDEQEVFFERMHATGEFEELLEALYVDFLELRLSPRWTSVVVPTLRAWAQGRPLDADAYQRARAHQPTPAAKPRPRRESSGRDAV